MGMNSPRQSSLRASDDASKNGLDYSFQLPIPQGTQLPKGILEESKCRMTLLGVMCALYRQLFEPSGNEPRGV